MMPKIYTRSLADLTPEQQQEVLSRARNKGYEIVVGDQPIAMPTLREMASTPGSELSEFIRGQGGSIGDPHPLAGHRRGMGGAAGEPGRAAG